MSLVSETRLDMDDHSQRFCGAKLQLKALLQQPEAGSVITRTPWTVMSALTSSPLNARLHAEPDRRAPRGETAGTRRLTRESAGESAPRSYRCAAARPLALEETRPRRCTARGTDYVLPSEEGGNRGIGTAGQVNLGRQNARWLIRGTSGQGTTVEHGNKLVAFIKRSLRFSPAAAPGIVRIRRANHPHPARLRGGGRGVVVSAH